MAPGEDFRIFASHIEASPALAAVADSFEIEHRLGADAYVAYALDFVQRNSIHVLLAHTRRSALSDHKAAFAAVGCQVITAGSRKVIRFLRGKTELYDKVTAAGGLGIAVPEFISAKGAAATMAAIACLRQRHGTVCIKPSAALGGHGFRIVSDLGGSYAGVFNGDFLPMTMAETEVYLARKVKDDREMMVMPYLGGPEHSLDCLSQQGKLVRAIDRVKFPGGLRELLDDRPDLVEAAARLTELLCLDGLYNVQFLESDAGVPYLLEINARMAGGTYIGGLTGVLLPYWAIRLAIGTATASDVPQPRTGMDIHMDRTTRAVITAEQTLPSAP